MSDETTTAVDPVIIAELCAYLAGRDDNRAQVIRNKWRALSPREQRLVREAAVMGYVQGARSVPGGWKAQIPPDREIVATVIDACLVFGDLYPTMKRLGSRRRAAADVAAVRDVGAEGAPGCA